MNDVVVSLVLWLEGRRDVSMLVKQPHGQQAVNTFVEEMYRKTLPADIGIE